MEHTINSDVYRHLNEWRELINKQDEAKPDTWTVLEQLPDKKFLNLKVTSIDGCDMPLDDFSVIKVNYTYDRCEAIKNSNNEGQV